MSFQIYLVEDELNLNQVLTSYLEKEGWEIRSFTRGEEARDVISNSPHLWILDIMLPDIDGFQLIREIKANSSYTPVIFISARDADFDRIIGLEMGSDDYLAKPFMPRELVIRTQKLLERTYGKRSDETSTEASFIGPYTMDEKKRMVKKNNEIVDLTSKEFEILQLFVSNPGQAFAREQILDMVWGKDYFGTDRVVDDLIRRLRKKMPELRLETMYGYGYRLVKS